MESPSARSGSFSLASSSPSSSSDSLSSPSRDCVPLPPLPISQESSAKHGKIGSLFMFKLKSFNVLSSEDLKQELTTEGRRERDEKIYN